MPLRTLILFVTSRCNARCGTCFYWQELNHEGDLTFDELDGLSRTMPRFEELWLSGGEPMMRPRLGEIVRMFHRRNGVRSINLPSNGLFEKRLVDLMGFVTREMPGLTVNLNIALDGFRDTHDRIRGVPGNFDKAICALEALYPAREANPRIRLHVNSVITADNVEELVALGRWLIDRMDLDGQYFQIIRGDVKDPSLKRVAPDRLRRFYDELAPIHDHYGQKLAGRRGGSVQGWVKKVLYTQTLHFHYAVQERNYERSNPWPMPCTAGQSIVVVDYNGDIRACELRSKVANLRDVGCDFSRIYLSDAMRWETDQIVEDQCWCTHICFIHDSLKSSRKAQVMNVVLGA